MKPYEVELCVAEVGDTPDNDQLYRLTFDGSVVDEPDFVVMGGQAEAVTGHLREHFHAGMGLSDALQVGVRALSAVSLATAGTGNGGAAGRLTAAQLEVAVLDRRRPKRAFRRVVGSALRTLLGDDATPDSAADAPDRDTATAHAPSSPEPGTPPGLGDPANPDTVGGTGATDAGAGENSGD
jgi:proteasome alpha subunit